MMKRLIQVAAVFVLIVAAGAPGFSQTNAVQNYLSKTLGQSPDQIAAIRSGQPYATNLESRSPAEIFVFGCCLHQR
jgi:hypothetical protein